KVRVQIVERELAEGVARVAAEVLPGSDQGQRGGERRLPVSIRRRGPHAGAEILEEGQGTPFPQEALELGGGHRFPRPGVTPEQLVGTLALEEHPDAALTRSP